MLKIDLERGNMIELILALISHFLLDLMVMIIIIIGL